MKFHDLAYFDPDYQVYRWKSNDQIPFDDMLEANGISSKTRLRCRTVRDAETRAFLDQYRANEAKRTVSPEELYEARAAFGPGHEIVNIITGRKFRT